MTMQLQPLPPMEPQRLGQRMGPGYRALIKAIKQLYADHRLVSRHCVTSILSRMQRGA